MSGRISNGPNNSGTNDLLSQIFTLTTGDSKPALIVANYDGSEISGGGGGGGTQYAENATTSPATGNASLGRYSSSPPSLTNGQMQMLQLDSSGNLNVNIKAGAGSGGTAIADEATFTQGTTSFTPVGGFYNAAVTNLTSGEGGAVQLTTDRNMFVNLNKVGGSLVSLGQQLAAASIPVILPSATITSLAQPTLQSGSTTAVTQATASNLNATVIGTGTFAVQATSSTATGSAVPADAYYNGAEAQTSNPSAATAGNLVGLMADKVGKLVSVQSLRQLKVQQHTTITASTAETTVLTAVSSIFLDVYGVIVANSSVTADVVTFKDSTGGTTRFVIAVPAGETRGFMLNESAAHNQATVNNNWTATSSASISSLDITMMAVENI